MKRISVKGAKVHGAKQPTKKPSAPHLKMRHLSPMGKSAYTPGPADAGAPAFPPAGAGGAAFPPAPGGDMGAGAAPPGGGALPPGL